MVGDCMLSNVSEHGISKQHSVKVRNFPGATTKNKLRYWQYPSVKIRSYNNSCRQQ